MVMEDMGDGERIEYIQLAHFMAFATDVIVHVQNYMDMLMQLNLPKDSTRLLGGVLLVDSEIINLIARVLTFPLLLKELENLSDVDKKVANHMFDIFLEVIGKLGKTVSRYSGPRRAFFRVLLSEWVKASQTIDEALHKYRGAKFTYNYLTTYRKQWDNFNLVIFGDCANVPMLECLYPRCPHPTPSMGYMYVCGKCDSATYCSHRCQNL
ncbi:hypothetical protein FRC12_025239 [Ceratobasidium sp. 428]|nr:hypothetical protein FRC12_025239 [Ceratobasidium sp. 428]